MTDYESVPDKQERFSCVVPEKNLRLLGTIVQCVNKIAETMIWEIEPDKLNIFALNGGCSAYFKFVLFSEFFEAYNFSGDKTSFSIMIKPCLAIFKSIKETRATIFTDEADNKLIFDMECPHSVRKTHKLFLEEGKAQKVIYDKSAANRFASSYELLSGILDNFPPGQEDISLGLGKQWVAFESYLDDAKANSGTPSVLTEMKVDINDFVNYELSQDIDNLQMSFSLKELKAACKFCEGPNTQLQVNIHGPGQPLVLSTRVPRSFEVDFVIATQSADAPASSQASNHAVQPASVGGSVTQVQHLTPKNRSSSSGTYASTSSSASGTPSSSMSASYNKNGRRTSAASEAGITELQGRTNSATRPRNEIDDNQMLSEHQPPLKRPKVEPGTASADNVDEEVPDSQE